MLGIPRYKLAFRCIDLARADLPHGAPVETIVDRARAYRAFLSSGRPADKLS